MKPIISPIWFYLFNLASKVGDFAMALIIGGIILTVIFAIFLFIVEAECDFESEKDGMVILKKVSLLSSLQEFYIVQFHQKQHVTG